MEPATPPPGPGAAGPLPETSRLHAVLARLRAPGGCPWDREQDPTTMAPHLLEEVHEAIDAITAGDEEGVREELGDVLMNVLMIAQMHAEAGSFDAEAVARGIADKLVRRHPHVFGDAAVGDAEQVLQNWEQIKRREKGDAEGPRSVLAGVPRGLPALLRAGRLGEKAARVGCDWPDRAGPRAKVGEELGELDEALAGGNAGRIEEEVGDLLFAVVNVARHAGVNPEMALRGTLDRFTTRFRRLERALGERLGEAGIDELEEVWQRVKRDG